MLPAEYPRHRPEPSTSCPCPAWFCPLWRPFFRGRKAAIRKALIPPELLPVIELGQEGAPEIEEHALFLPRLEPTPAGRGTAVPLRQLAPRGPGPEDPQNPFETPPIVHTRPSSSRLRFDWRELQANLVPLSVRHVSPCHAPTLSMASPHSQVLK